MRKRVIPLPQHKFGIISARAFFRIPCRFSNYTTTFAGAALNTLRLPAIWTAFARARRRRALRARRFAKLVARIGCATATLRVGNSTPHLPQTNTSYLFSSLTLHWTAWQLRQTDRACLQAFMA